MMQIVPIGIAAGLASALLFASVASGSPMAIPLSMLAPLPVLIATLGWSHVAGLIAASMAALGLGVAFGGVRSVEFLIEMGLPAWWLGYLALLARPGATASAASLEWYPAGRLVIWSALLGAFVGVVGVAKIGLDVESIQGELRPTLEKLFRVSRAATSAGIDPSGDITVPNDMVEWLSVWIPRIAAVPPTVSNLINFWLAGRIVKASSRLKRPWPDFAAVTFPPFVPALLAAAVAGTFLPGIAAIASWAVVASLTIAYTVLGFAVLHATTRTLAGRGFMLGGTYLIVIVFIWPTLAVALVGLLETALDLRGRIARRRGPPAPTA